jgi:hypothetical protein
LGRRRLIGQVIGAEERKCHDAPPARPECYAAREAESMHDIKS